MNLIRADAAAYCLKLKHSVSSGAACEVALKRTADDVPVEQKRCLKQAAFLVQRDVPPLPGRLMSQWSVVVYYVFNLP